MLLHIRWQFIKGMINGGTLFGAKLLNYIVYVFGDALLMLIYISCPNLSDSPFHPRRCLCLDALVSDGSLVYRLG
jgi:hypothetical protein